LKRKKKEKKRMIVGSFVTEWIKMLLLERKFLVLIPLIKAIILDYSLSISVR